MEQDLESLVDWLRNAPSTEWCGAMLSKAADAIERLERERAAKDLLLDMGRVIRSLDESP